MSSENPTGADNQQETAESRLELEPQWIVGFVDGEGCFSVSIHCNPNARSTGGWQLHPVFHVYQHVRYRAVLEELVVFFGCGRVRPKGPKSSVWTFAVDSLKRQEESVLPFFERYPLVVKDADFRKFAAIVRMMRRKEHLTADGFEQPRRDPDGILRDCTLGTDDESVKIQSDPHGDMGSQAEMTWPRSRHTAESGVTTDA